ncbi:MAG TPA: ATP-binding protein [Desulfonatronum sp.]|nr:ATP-binding protein [Desulfonatronum sp.]
MSFIPRPRYLAQLESAVRRSPVTAILGPRQCGKTTLARLFSSGRKTTFFDLESQPDVQRLQNPELVLGSAQGLVVLDEIQVMPELFKVLRVLADRRESGSRFLILGSASPDIVKNASESLAGRVEFIHLSGFDLSETGTAAWEQRWVRGGFPKSYLAASDEDGMAWREGFVRTFLERDIPQLGILIPATAMRRFWTMLAHYHSQTWNGAELGRSMGLTSKTVRSYLDILSGTFMVRQLQPWFENLGKRQVKAPKIYLRDSGLFHALLGIPHLHGLLGNPKVGASWEGFVIEQVIQLIQPAEAFFWATHQGAEIDLLFMHEGRRFGVECKFSEAPTPTKSLRIAMEDLELDHAWIICPGPHTYPVDEKITVLSIKDVINEMRFPPRADGA